MGGVSQIRLSKKAGLWDWAKSFPCAFLEREKGWLAHFLPGKLKPESPWSQDPGRGHQSPLPLAIGMGTSLLPIHKCRGPERA